MLRQDDPPPLEILLAFVEAFPGCGLEALPHRQLRINVPKGKLLGPRDQAILELVQRHAGEIWTLCTLPGPILQAAVAQRQALLQAARAQAGNGAGDHAIAPAEPATPPDPAS